MENRRKTGDAWEIIAIEYLQKHDYTIIDTNYTIQGGEIDIVAKKDAVHIFIEVKLRSSNFFWSPEEALTKNKRRSLLFAIKHFCMKKWISLDDVRFDFIGIEKRETAHRISHYRNIPLL